MQTSTPRPTADLNVTPLIDVLLVLLVIFMATLPLAQKSLDSTVPSQTRAPGAVSTQQIVVQYERSGQVSINQQPVALSDLSARLREIYEPRTDKTLYILGDPGLRYQLIVHVIDVAKGAGVQRVGIITEAMRKG